MKLTAITIQFKGRTLTEFHKIPLIMGKAVCPKSIVDKMLATLGVQRGMTYSLS